MTEGESEQDAKAVGTAKRAPKRLGVGLLLALIALAAFVVFVRRPVPPSLLSPLPSPLLRRV